MLSIEQFAETMVEQGAVKPTESHRIGAAQLDRASKGVYELVDLKPGKLYCPQLRGADGWRFQTERRRQPECPAAVAIRFLVSAPEMTDSGLTSVEGIVAIYDGSILNTNGNARTLAADTNVTDASLNFGYAAIRSLTNFLRDASSPNVGNWEPAPPEGITFSPLNQ